MSRATIWSPAIFAPVLFCAQASLAAPPALVAGASCALEKSLKMSVKEKGETRWVALEKGALVVVLEPGDEWSKVEAKGQAGRASSAQLVERCAFESAPPVVEAAAPPPSEPAKASPEPAPVEVAPPPPADATASSEAAPAPPVVEAAAAAPDAVESPPVVDAPPPSTAEPPALAAPAQGDGRPLVAVLDLRASEGEGGMAAALATVVTAELAARDDVRAISRNEIQAMVAHKAEQALLGCESVKCAADLGRLVEADLVVTGGVEQVGEAYVFSLSLIDPVANEVRERVEATWRSSPDEIVVLVRPTVDRLLGGVRAASFKGALEVLAPDGAEIFVDGRSVGSAPLAAPLADLAIGVHVLEVSKAGHASHRRDVVVARNETTVARVELEEEPLYTQWWFWTAIGGGAAVAVAAGATVGTVAIIAASEPPPTTLSVKAALPATAR